MKRYKIAENVYLTEAFGDYKKSRLSVYMYSPIKRETITDTALIPYLLERGTRSLPDMTLLKRRLNSLYGANMYACYSLFAMSRVIGGFIAGVDGRLAGNSELSAEREHLLLDMFFDPAVKDGGFDDALVDIEREKLRDAIQSVINDKRDYCLHKLDETFFRNDERAMPNEGYEADLDGIDGKRLYSTYKSYVDGASVEIFYVGQPCDGLAERLSKSYGDRKALPVKPLAAVPYGEEIKTVEAFDIEQDKLGIAYTTGRLLNERETNALRLASAILGGTATSRFFMNVREKQSLCYYAAARQSYTSGGGLLVDLGIAHGNADRARNAVEKELYELAEHGPTEKELSETKLFFKSILNTVGDTSKSLESFCRSGVEKYGRIITPSQDIEAIESVSADEIRAVLSLMKPAASCLITRKD